jgi:hypothetical protein
MRLFAFALLLPPLWTSCDPRLACAQNESAAPSEFQIEVAVPGPFRNEPIQYRLGTLNFSLFIEKQALPFRLTQPLQSQLNLSTHLLIVFPPGTKHPESNAILRALKKPLELGWYVSANRIDGHFTQWCNTRPALANALLQNGNSLPLSEAQAAVWTNVSKLAGFAGRRVLLFVGLPGNWELAFGGWRGKFGEIYVVDGGVETTETLIFNPFGRDGQEMGGAGTPESVETHPKYHRRLYRDEIAHEKNLGSAIKDIVADAHNYYYLTFIPPKAASTSRESIQLVLHQSPKVVASMYSVRIAERQGTRTDLTNGLKVTRNVLSNCPDDGRPSCNY